MARRVASRLSRKPGVGKQLSEDAGPSTTCTAVNFHGGRLVDVFSGPARQLAALDARAFVRPQFCGHGAVRARGQQSAAVARPEVVEQKDGQEADFGAVSVVRVPKPVHVPAVGLRGDTGLATVGSGELGVS